MTRFEIKVSGDGTKCELWVAGDVDLASAEEFSEMALLGLRTKAVNTLVIDLGAVDFLDSTGMGALVTVRNEVVALGTELRLREVPERVRKVLEVAGLDTAFSIDNEFRTDR